MLKKALIANSVFSLVSGLALAALPQVFADLMGISPTWLVRLVGVGVFLFGLDVGWTATRPTLSRVRATLVCLMDASWVAGSAVLLVIWGSVLSGAGQVIVAAVAVAVGSFMVAQLIGLRREVMA